MELPRLLFARLLLVRIFVVGHDRTLLWVSLPKTISNETSSLEASIGLPFEDIRRGLCNERGHNAGGKYF
jgi:hypothetical protein